MSNSVAGIIFSNLNDNTLSRLTEERTVAAIPFACRYRLVDFCISNMINAGVSNVNIVANYNYRSLIEHIGSGKDYDLARRIGGINIISPLERTVSKSTAIFSTHMEALKSMVDYISEFREEYVVLMDSDTVLNIDLKEVIRFHEDSGAKITFVSKLIDPTYTSRTPRMMISKQNDRIIDISMSTVYNQSNPELALNIFVIRTEDLKRMISIAMAHEINSLTSMLLTSYKREAYSVYSYRGFVASVSSFLDYYRYSIELATKEESRRSLLGNKNLPIFTRIHNSSPTSYTESARIESSIIADDCVIEGTVIDSVIFRGVHVSKGAVIKNSILFHGTTVDINANLDCIVADKNVTVSKGTRLTGTSNMPFYIEKQRRV